MWSECSIYGRYRVEYDYACSCEVDSNDCEEYKRVLRSRQASNWKMRRIKDSFFSSQSSRKLQLTGQECLSGVVLSLEQGCLHDCMI